MKTPPFFLLCCLILPVLCSGAETSAAVGVYRKDDIYLTLFSNGTYMAQWGSVGKEIGKANGTWRSEGEEVRLTPKSESGRLEGHLRILYQREVKGKKRLLRKEDLARARNEFFYYNFIKKPGEDLNKTTKPTLPLTRRGKQP